MRRIPWKLLGAGALTAILLDLSFPLAGPMSAWEAWIAWAALVPLLAELMRLPLDFQIDPPGQRKRWWQPGCLGWSFLAGWLCGALWFGTNCYWVYGTMHNYAGMGAVMASVCQVLFSLFLGFWFGVFGLAVGLVRLATFQKRYAWVALASVPFFWVAMEFALARVPYFPWDLLGYSQVDSGLLMRLAPWTGVYGISFTVAGVNSLLAAWRLTTSVEKQRRWLRFKIDSETAWYALTVLCWIALVLSAGVVFAPPKPTPTATAVLVQPNLDVGADDVWVGPEWDLHMEQFTKLGARTCASFVNGIPETGAATTIPECTVPPVAPSLIVWPESPAPFRDKDEKFQKAMAEIVAADHAPMIVGNVGIDEDPVAQQYKVFNSASVVALDGRFVGRYDKIHLVPFGEYIPYRDLLFFAKQVTQTLTDMSTGWDRKVFTIPDAKGGHRYGVFICYESVFGDEVRQFALHGAEVLVNISDDGWYGDTSAPWQHLNMARMRAIENRRWILRDTNNGVTSAIDPYGVVRQSIPRHQVGALAAQYGFNSELTFYTLHGDWFPALCAILSLVLLVWSGRVLLGEMAPKGSAWAA